jgi:hypothetical protein
MLQRLGFRRTRDAPTPAPLFKAPDESLTEEECAWLEGLAGLLCHYPTVPSHTIPNLALKWVRHRSEEAIAQQGGSW